MLIMKASYQGTILDLTQLGFANQLHKEADLNL